MLPLLLRVLNARAMTGSEAQRKLLLGNATLLAYCLRWQEFRARALPLPQLYRIVDRVGFKDPTVSCVA